MSWILVQGGVRRPEFRHVLQGSHKSNPLVCIVDLGEDPLDCLYPQRIPPQGGPPFGGDATVTRYRGAVGVPAFGSSYGGRRPEVGGDVRPTPP